MKKGLIKPGEMMINVLSLPVWEKGLFEYPQIDYRRIITKRWND